MNEIVWKRSDAHNDAKQGATHFGRVHDVIFRYQVSEQVTFNPLYTELPQSTADKWYRYIEPETGRRFNKADVTGPGRKAKGNPFYEWNGVSRYWRYSRDTMQRLHDEGRLIYTKSGMTYQKRYLDESRGVPVQDWWDDIEMLRGISDDGERLGYPTQKPRALLERIIVASSNPHDLVLDPFCGCGTAIDAAQKLGRRWIGIDITHLALGLVEKRLREGYGDAVAFETIGVPKDLASAQRLARDDPHQFQAWITLKLGGYPWRGGRKGGDRGVDGHFYYVGEGGRTETGVISVKAGDNINPGMVRDLVGVMTRDGRKLGLFVCAAMPTRGMEQEADKHGLIETEWGRVPAVQLFTLAELFQDRQPKLPPLVSPNRRAARVETRASHQAGAQAKLQL